jgi:hypothetical protein
MCNGSAFLPRRQPCSAWNNILFKFLWLVLCLGVIGTLGHVLDAPRSRCQAAHTFAAGERSHVPDAISRRGDDVMAM